MHDDRLMVEGRLERALRERIRPAVNQAPVPLDIAAWVSPNGPVSIGTGIGAPFKPAAVGDSWGAPWATVWFRFTGQVPAHWRGRTVEAVIDLGFALDRPGFSAEGLAYRPDRTPIKGLNPRNTWLRPNVGLDGEVEFYVEAAANPLIEGPVTLLGDPLTAGNEPLYRIARADLTLFDETVWELVQDLEVLGQLMLELSTHDPRRWSILRAIERALDALDLQDVPGTAGAARQRLAGVLAQPAHASAHRISAIGHAHIDSAWLWPARETIRKVARTAANVTALMDEHPEFLFGMSQAQQLAWLREHRPEVYERVKDKVATGQFVPIGGMWVESDTNLPGGEAMARQFVHGKRFFLEEFGIETEEVWLPDTFGFSAALPQLIRLSGSRWFLSTKLSWNQVNPFPHHTFRWEGIDGTRVFSHFPPINNFNSDLCGAEMARAVRNFTDKGVASRSLAPFGWGDGGGGPTREILARAARLSNLEGSPRVAIERPAEFFAAAEAEHPHAPVWVGELYLEIHRGTYTTQAKIKQANRRAEHLLREAELWSATAAIRHGYDYPYATLDRIWKVVLLHQFHDILPGSSISWVNRETMQTYGEIMAELESLIGAALRVLAGVGSSTVAFNAAPHARDGVPALGAAVSKAERRVRGEGFVLDNGVLRVTIDGRGLVVSVVDVATQREAVAPGEAANLLQVHPDLPNEWDAWDIDGHYRRVVRDIVDVVSMTRTEDGSVRVERRFGASTVVQTIALEAGARAVSFETEVDWHEREKLLKVAFPLDLHADRSAAETQFGHVFRPTHTNTSWEAAKFEICAHRWVHVGEPDWGVAVVNDSTYGHDVTRDRRAGGGTTTTVRLSLLRAPRFPDPETDQGQHRFRYALVPAASIGDAVRAGYRINLPMRSVRGGSEGVVPLVELDNEAVVVEAVKLADDESGDLIVRLYESRGARAQARLTFNVPVESIVETDLLERPFPDRAALDADGMLRLRPFQIVTLRIRR
ncbi:alpha-mannosidase [Allorhizocola rhizosphaerae]|uniref:alpha-mannosidase n=1 Tax=Allorhizocola rhizosphaerae TaxID=1872709 RepID=UPI000E3E7F39|nr:glycoside hydrolase family 38 C-terminal domain-containing protein [Allorhizocola rhizosphaerae]